MPEKVFNVAAIGTGGIWRLAHGPAWGRIPRARVVATCDVVEERAAEARRTSGARRHFTDADALLAEADDVDVVDICTPSHTHADLAVKALEAGLHVICEKPLALRPKDAERVIRVARENDRRVLVGHTRRFDARWVAMKSQMDAGRIGEPVAIRRAERCWGGFPAGDWHWDVERSGGVLMDLGIHVVDLFSWFYDAQPVEVYAKARTVRDEARETGCPDLATVLVGYPGGRRGLLEVSWAHPKAWAPWYSDTEVVGSKGKLSLSDKDTAPMSVAREGGLEVPRYSPLLSSNPEAFVAELSHFLDCIEGEAEPRITPQAAAKAVEVVDAAFRSIETGKPVALAEVAVR